MTEPAGLYIHIPFCDAKCSYCDFVTFTDRPDQIDSYLRAVAFELSCYPHHPIKTVFIGGGTPTVLSPSQIDFLFSSIRRTLNLSPLIEATAEANPESASHERLEAFKNNGINRISFGLQTTQNPLLKKLGRLHSVEKFFGAFETARLLGFRNINVDLIFGLPGQSLPDWKQTLQRVVAVNPEHISAYALKIEPGTKMTKEKVVVDGDLEADMYLLASDYLTERGYEHYEISNFAKPGYEAQHNLLYWKNEDVIGVGVSSASYMHGRRFKNTKRIQAYIDDCLARRVPVREQAVLDEPQQHKESLMLQLRLRRGVDQQQLEALNIPMASTFLRQGLATVEKGMYSLTPQGWLLSNLLFQQFV